jgi:sec-independent protein translocase protein TatA
MPSLGIPELLIILVLVLIVFGAGKLPNVMRSMGEGVKEFREASEGTGADKSSDSEDGKAEAKADEAKADEAGGTQAASDSAEKTGEQGD